MSRVLIVDDDPMARSLIEDVLRHRGYETVHTDDGLGALDILGHNADFDVLLSDIRMPRLDGLHLLEAVTVSYPHIPVILSSVHSRSDLVENAVQKGAACFLPRPFRPHQLVEAVQQVTQGRRITAAPPGFPG